MPLTAADRFRLVRKPFPIVVIPPVRRWAGVQVQNGLDSFFSTLFPRNREGHNKAMEDLIQLYEKELAEVEMGDDL